jgi:hypothetical protein
VVETEKEKVEQEKAAGGKEKLSSRGGLVLPADRAQVGDAASPVKPEDTDDDAPTSTSNPTDDEESGDIADANQELTDAETAYQEAQVKIAEAQARREEAYKIRNARLQEEADRPVSPDDPVLGPYDTRETITDTSRSGLRSKSRGSKSDRDREQEREDRESKERERLEREREVKTARQSTT